MKRQLIELASTANAVPPGWNADVLLIAQCQSDTCRTSHETPRRAVPEFSGATCTEHLPRSALLFSEKSREEMT